MEDAVLLESATTTLRGSGFRISAIDDMKLSKVEEEDEDEDERA